MSDADNLQPQPPKPSRLSGLVAPKGAAPRPGEQQVPTAATEPAPNPIATAPARISAPVPAPPAGTGSKSLTLRLHDAEYERLRAQAFTSRMTHQAILAEALRLYLDAAENSQQ